VRLHAPPSSCFAFSFFPPQFYQLLVHFPSGDVLDQLQYSVRLSPLVLGSPVLPFSLYLTTSHLSSCVWFPIRFFPMLFFFDLTQTVPSDAPGPHPLQIFSGSSLGSVFFSEFVGLREKKVGGNFSPPLSSWSPAFCLSSCLGGSGDIPSKFESVPPPSPFRRGPWNLMLPVPFVIVFPGTTPPPACEAVFFCLLWRSPR